MLAANLHAVDDKSENLTLKYAVFFEHKHDDKRYTMKIILIVIYYYYYKPEMRSVERGICPIATFTMNELLFL